MKQAVEMWCCLRLQEKTLNYSQLNTRWLQIGEILSFAWSLFRLEFKKILVVVLVVYAATFVTIQFFPYEPFIWLFEKIGINLTAYMLNLIEWIFDVIIIMAISHLIERAIKEDKITWYAALRLSVSRWPLFIATNILMVIILLFLFLLLLIPGIIWSVYYTFTIFAVSLRHRTGMKALDYSKVLVKGDWWRVFGYSLAIGFISLMLGRLIGVVSEAFPNSFVYQIIFDLLTYLAWGYFIVAWSIFFLNIDSLKSPDRGDVTLTWTLRP